MDELLQSAASLGIDPEGKRHARHEPSVSEVPFNIKNYLYVVLAWVLTAAPDAVPIPGTKRRAYLDDNLGAQNVHLTPEDMAELNQLASMAVGDRYPEAIAKAAER